MRQINGAYVAESVGSVPGVESDIHPYIAEEFAQFQPQERVPPLPRGMLRCDSVVVRRLPGVNRGLIPAAAMCQSGWIVNPIFKRYRLIILPTPEIWGGAKFGGAAEVS